MSPTEPPATTTDAVDLDWLRGPRWGAVAAYVLALGLSRIGVLQPMPWLPVAGGAALTAVLNLALSGKQREAPARLTQAVLASDILLLTVVLYLSGGASNPLTALYLIPISLSAMLLPASWSWALTALSITAFGLLFFADDTAVVAASQPIDHAGHAGHGAHADHGAHTDHSAHSAHAGHAAHGSHEGHFSLHLRGMWVAFTLTAVSVAYFITRVTSALRRRERQLSSAKTRALRAERVAAMASLAGSTAHELGTPLASIRLAATEMERAITRGASPESLLDDARLVADQAQRCREILDAMQSEAGETVGEAPVDVAMQQVVDDALGLIPSAERARLDVELSAELPRARLPRRSVAQSLHNLLRNALDASANESRVRLAVDATPSRIRFSVQDQGVGMSADELSEAMEPFVTNKPRGQGLGLFLARSVAEGLGGQLVLNSTPGRGTVASLEVAREGVHPEPDRAE